MLELNSDGVSVKGCSLIYAPQARQVILCLGNEPVPRMWPQLRILLCSQSVADEPPGFDAGARLRDNYIPKLRREADKYKASESPNR